MQIFHQSTERTCFTRLLQPSPKEMGMLPTYRQEHVWFCGVKKKPLGTPVLHFQTCLKENKENRRKEPKTVARMANLHHLFLLINWTLIN